MISRCRMTQQRCERGADWVVRSLERKSVDFPWEVSAALHIILSPNARHNTPPVYANAPLDKSLYSVVFTVLGRAFGVTHSRHYTSPATAAKHRNGWLSIRLAECDIGVNESTFYWVVDKTEETVSESHLTSEDRNICARSCHKWYFSDKSTMQRACSG